MLSQAVYWSNRTNDPGKWFYKTQAEWTDETGLSRFEQESTRKKLKNLGILEEKLKGQPARLFYKVNFKALESELNNANKIARNSQSSMLETDKLERHKLASKSARNSQTIYTETTTETTTDISANAQNIEKTKNKKFTVPTIEEIAEYIKAKNYQVDAEAFFNYYESVNWMIGNRKMAKWQAALVTWEKRRKTNQANNQPTKRILREI
jgi:hypothetical protein